MDYLFRVVCLVYNGTKTWLSKFPVLHQINFFSPLKFEHCFDQILHLKRNKLGFDVFEDFFFFLKMWKFYVTVVRHAIFCNSGVCPCPKWGSSVPLTMTKLRHN